jgi:hypothetical protein
MSIKVEKLRINSYHNARFNSKADGISVAGIGIGNTSAYNSINPEASVQVGDNAALVAADLIINAYNNVEKPWLSGGEYNVQSKSGSITSCSDSILGENRF